jgi:acyl-coenzyme A thioesterase PaaI-like protein
MEPELAGRALTAAPGDDGVEAAVAAARRVIAALLHAGDRPEAGIAEVADMLDAVASQLEGLAVPVRQRLADMWRGERIGRYDPVAGPQNAIAPPLRLYGRSDGSVEGTVTLGLPYQGPPGLVHGGISAMLLDHALGAANYWAGSGTAMTAELTLRYLRPVPLFEPLAVVARRQSVDGRKIRGAGTISASGQVCVSAEALFIGKEIPVPGRAVPG